MYRLTFVVILTFAMSCPTGHCPVSPPVPSVYSARGLIPAPRVVPSVFKPRIRIWTWQSRSRYGL